MKLRGEAGKEPEVLVPRDKEMRARVKNIAHFIHGDDLVVVNQTEVFEPSPIVLWDFVVEVPPSPIAQLGIAFGLGQSLAFPSWESQVTFFESVPLFPSVRDVRVVPMQDNDEVIWPKMT